MLGHASATLTLDRYGHLFGDDLDAVAERIDAAHSKNRADYSRCQVPVPVFRFGSGGRVAGA
jgi:hypothetical protein